MTTFLIITALVAAFAAYAWYNLQRMKKMPAVANHQSIKELTDQNFQHQIKSGLHLVDFWAPWCMPCKMIAPVLNDLAADNNHKATIGKVNIDDFQAIAARHNVRSIPTLILFKNGKEVERIVGVKTKDHYIKQINKHQ